LFRPSLTIYNREEKPYTNNITLTPSAKILELLRTGTLIRRLSFDTNITVHTTDKNDDKEDQLLVHTVVLCLQTVKLVEKLSFRFMAKSKLWENPHDEAAGRKWGNRRKSYPAIFSRIREGLIGVGKVRVECSGDLPPEYMCTWWAKPGEFLRWDPENTKNDEECHIAMIKQAEDKVGPWAKSWTGKGKGCRIHGNDLESFLSALS